MIILGVRCPACERVSSKSARTVDEDRRGLWCLACGHHWQKAKYEGLTPEGRALAMAEEGRKELAALEARRKPPWAR